MTLEDIHFTLCEVSQFFREAVEKLLAVNWEAGIDQVLDFCVTGSADSRRNAFSATSLMLFEDISVVSNVGHQFLNHLPDIDYSISFSSSLQGVHPEPF